MKTIFLTLCLMIAGIISSAQIPSTSGDVRLSDIYEDERASVFDGGTIVINGTLFIDTSLYLHSTNIQANRVVIGNPNRFMFIHITGNASITTNETHMPFDKVYLFAINKEAGGSFETNTLTGEHPEYILAKQLRNRDSN